MKKLLAVLLIGIVVGAIAWHFLQPKLMNKYTTAKSKLRDTLGDISWIPAPLKPERTWQTDFMAMLNVERAKTGFPALVTDPGLQSIAQQYAEARARQAEGQSDIDWKFLRPLRLQWLRYDMTYDTAGANQDQYIVLYRMLENPMKNIMLTEYYTHAGVGKAYDREGHAHWCLIVADQIPRL